MEGLERGKRQALLAAGSDPKMVEGFQAALGAFSISTPPDRKSLAADALQARAIYDSGENLLRTLPPKGKRDAAQAQVADTIKGILRSARNAFARAYLDLIYRQVTDEYRRFVRAEELVYEVARLFPGLCPTRREVEAELEKPLFAKEAVEVAQGDFLSRVFSHRVAGDHLLQAMLQPLPQSPALLEKFLRDGRADLGTARVEKQGPLGCVLFNNLPYLNAEDDGTALPWETAVDLVLLHPGIEVGLLRGNPMNHPKYQGRRVFSAGLNLTHLYCGKLPLMFFFTRDLGFVNKLHRGLAGEDYDPDRPESTREKPWIAAVESFAIGGGCQILLVMDYVVAEEGSYLSLPARKEGIVPGVAPLRLPRFMGERLTQQGVLFDKIFEAGSPEARGIVNEVVPAGQMDEAIGRVVSTITGSGVISIGANRKAIRLGQEPREKLREYMALYCRDQADCHFSPGLVANLERNWNAKHRCLEKKG